MDGHGSRWTRIGMWGIGSLITSICTAVQIAAIFCANILIIKFPAKFVVQGPIVWQQEIIDPIHFTPLVCNKHFDLFRTKYAPSLMIPKPNGQYNFISAAYLKIAEVEERLEQWTSYSAEDDIYLSFSLRSVCMLRHPYAATGECLTYKYIDSQCYKGDLSTFHYTGITYVMTILFLCSFGFHVLASISTFLVTYDPPPFRLGLASSPLLIAFNFLISGVFGKIAVSLLDQELQTTVFSSTTRDFALYVPRYSVAYDQVNYYCYLPNMILAVIYFILTMVSRYPRNKHKISHRQTTFQGECEQLISLYS